MRLYRNIFHLLIWQGSMYLVPLIVTPYLTRTLGLHGYGVFGFSLAVCIYVMLLTDWGFNVSASQKVARAAEDPEELRRLFWSTMSARVMLATAALAALFVAILAVPEFRAIWPVLLASSLIALTTALSANFFLQGLQFMGAFAVSSLFGKLMVIPLMLVFVHGPQDVVLAALIQNGTQLISAVVSLVVAARLVPLLPFHFDPRGGWREVKDGWHQFISNFSISLYTQANAVVLGFTAGSGQVGLLTSSQRISQAFQQLVTPINMAVYPQVNRLTHSDPPAAVRLMFRVLAAQSAFACCVGLGMFAFAPVIVPAFLGHKFMSAVPVVRMLAGVPFLAGVTTVLGGNMLLPLGLKRQYMLILLLSGLANIGFLFVFTPRYQAFGGALCAVLTESVLLASMAATLYRNRDVFTRMMAGEPPPE